MEKILSIIVPTYNMEKYLRKCLDSLIVSDENMKLLEVLVVNDGSKDSSSQIAHEYETKYPQTFKVIDKENGNYGSCINRGLKDATGKYVKVLDADDSFVAEILDNFIKYLHLQDADLIINDFVKVNESGSITESYVFDLPTDKDFILNDIPMGQVHYIFHHGITYRTSILHDINYHQTEGISYTDDEWIFMPMYRVRRVLYFPNVLYRYLRGREGQTFDMSILKSAYSKRIIVGTSMLDFYVKNDNDCPATNRMFIEKKLIKKLSGFYHFYLIKAYSKNSNECLKEFDLYIKDRSTYIYDLLGQIEDRIIGNRYIMNWRMSNYRCTPYLQIRQNLYYVYSWIRKIFNAK